MRIDNIFFNLLVWICVVVGGISKNLLIVTCSTVRPACLLWRPPQRPRNPSDALSEKNDAFGDSKGRFVLLKTSVRRKSSTYLPSVVGCWNIESNISCLWMCVLIEFNDDIVYYSSDHAVTKNGCIVKEFRVFKTIKVWSQTPRGGLHYPQRPFRELYFMRRGECIAIVYFVLFIFYLPYLWGTDASSIHLKVFILLNQSTIKLWPWCLKMFPINIRSPVVFGSRCMSF